MRMHAYWSDARLVLLDDAALVALTEQLEALLRNERCDLDHDYREFVELRLSAALNELDTRVQLTIWDELENLEGAGEAG